MEAETDKCAEEGCCLTVHTFCPSVSLLDFGELFLTALLDLFAALSAAFSLSGPSPSEESLFAERSAADNRFLSAPSLLDCPWVTWLGAFFLLRTWGWASLFFSTVSVKKWSAGLLASSLPLLCVSWESSSVLLSATLPFASTSLPFSSFVVPSFLTFTLSSGKEDIEETLAGPDKLCDPLLQLFLSVDSNVAI